MIPSSSVVEVPEEGLPCDFGKYRLVKRIATGGMAEIFLAHHRDRSEEALVIKRILPHLAKSPEFVSMFLDEARIAARFQHPNIVQIEDLGQIDGAYYIAMEYVHGEDIRRIYNRAYKLQRSLPLSHSITVIADAAMGLGYAHKFKDEFTGKTVGVVHRDVSPQNILVTYEGTVKVVDFGIAKAANKVAQTRAGVLKGKYSYMSPEQALGDPIDQRTDIFALGIILYETTTGTRLFKRHNELATLQAIIKCEFTPPSEALPGYPSGLETVLLRSLEKHPADRYADAEEFAQALYGFLKESRLYVERSVIADFMHDLFEERAGDAVSGIPVLPSQDEVREEMRDSTTPMKPRPETEEDGEPDRTEEQSEVSVTAKEEDVDLSELSDLSVPEKRKRTEVIRPPPDQAVTIAAQPAYADAIKAPVVSMVPPEAVPPERSLTDHKRGERTEQVRARPVRPDKKRPPRDQTEDEIEPEKKDDGLRRVLIPAGIVLGAIFIAIIAGVLASKLVTQRRINDPIQPQPPPPQLVIEPTGKVSLMTEPGAQIFANGELLGTAGPDGEAGPYSVNSGSVILRVANESVGFARERDVEIQAGQNYQFEIRARQGWLRLAIAPWAKVAIDGKDLGMTPLPKMSLYEGVHQVSLENPDLQRRYTTTVRIVPGEQTELKVDLEDVGERM
jgi:eukaryotic-like serine/threonine-protein kinase